MFVFFLQGGANKTVLLRPLRASSLGSSAQLKLWQLQHALSKLQECSLW